MDGHQTQITFAWVNRCLATRLHFRSRVAVAARIEPDRNEIVVVGSNPTSHSRQKRFWPRYPEPLFYYNQQSVIKNAIK